jgi:hypothetical protein
VLGKLHFLSCDDEDNKKKELKNHIGTLKAMAEEIKNLLSCTFLFI